MYVSVLLCRNLISAVFFCSTIICSLLLSSDPLSSSATVSRRRSAPPTPVPPHPFYLRSKLFSHFSRSPRYPFSRSPMHPFGSSSKHRYHRVNYSIPPLIFLPGFSQRPGTACGYISASPSSAHGSILASTSSACGIYQLLLCSPVSTST